MVLFKGRGTEGGMAEVGALKQARLAFVVTLLVILGGCTGRPDGVEPVTSFDIGRYQGVWYEVMRLDHSFERGLTNVTATYTLREGESVGVLNRGFHRANCRWKVSVTSTPPSPEARTARNCLLGYR